MAAGLLAAIMGGIILHLVSGPIETGPIEALKYLASDDGSNAAFSVRDIRLPRALNAVLVGAGLAMSGTLIQVITRNPLGDPGLTGVSSGAALGVALVISLWTTAGWAVVIGGITGGGIAAAITFFLARCAGMQDLSVILSGIAVSVFFLAVTSAVMILDKSSMQTLYYWMIGGFANKGWVEFSSLWVWILVGGGLSLLAAPVLELLRLEDSVAAGLGVQTGLWRLAGGALSVVLAAVAVAVAGPVGFVGFVAPHLVRRMFASAQGQVSLLWLLPLAALTGGLITLSADLAARLLPIGNRAPAGVLATVLGGIAFLILARRMRGVRV